MDKSSFYAYIYLRKNGTPYYVGKGKGLRAFYSYKYSRSVQRPSDPQRIIILERKSEQEAFETEKELIRNWGRLDLGTGCLHNHTNGGEGISGLLRSKEHSRKIQEAKKGFKLSEKSKEKMRIAHLGQKLSEQAKKKLSLAFKGRQLSEDHKRKIGKSNQLSLTGRKLTEEHCQKISNGLKFAYATKQHSTRKGLPLSIEHREKISLAMMGNKNQSAKKRDNS